MTCNTTMYNLRGISVLFFTVTELSPPQFFFSHKTPICWEFSMSKFSFPMIGGLFCEYLGRKDTSSYFNTRQPIRTTEIFLFAPGPCLQKGNKQTNRLSSKFCVISLSPAPGKEWEFFYMLLFLATTITIQCPWWHHRQGRQLFR